MFCSENKCGKHFGKIVSVLIASAGIFYLVANHYDNSRQNDDGIIALNDLRPAAKGSQAPSLATPGVSQSTVSADWLIPIDTHLRSLREKNIPRAYNESTSKEFRASTPLNNFVQFLESYPALINHKAIVVTSHSVIDNVGDITITLDPEISPTEVRFILKHEDGSWKIWSMNVVQPYTPAVTALLKDPMTLRKPVLDFLMTLRDDVSKAYEMFMSKEFQQSTSLDAFRGFIKTTPLLLEYETIDFDQPVIKEATGQLITTLNNTAGTAKIEYILGIQDDQWKIWGIKVLQNTVEGEKALPDEQISNPAVASRFDKVEIGTSIDAEGNIVKPGMSLESPTGDIYVNLFVRNGIAGMKIELQMEHLDSQATLPSVSTTLQQTGDSRLSFSFAPPMQGWPKGRYKIKAKSSAGDLNNYLFNVL